MNRCAFAALAAWSILIAFPAHAATVDFSSFGAFTPCGGEAATVPRNIRTRRTIESTTFVYNPTFSDLTTVSNFDPANCAPDPNYPDLTHSIANFQITAISDQTISFAFETNRPTIYQLSILSVATQSLVLSPFFDARASFSNALTVFGLLPNSDYTVRVVAYAIEPLASEIPIPASSALMFSGVAGFGLGLRRRRSHQQAVR